MINDFGNERLVKEFQLEYGAFLFMSSSGFAMLRVGVDYIAKQIGLPRTEWVKGNGHFLSDYKVLEIFKEHCEQRSNCSSLEGYWDIVEYANQVRLARNELAHEIGEYWCRTTAVLQLPSSARINVTITVLREHVLSHKDKIRQFTRPIPPFLNALVSEKITRKE